MSLFCACVAKTSCSAFGRVEIVGDAPRSPAVIWNYHLADSFAIVYCEWSIRQVYENDFYFSPIIRVYCSGRIEDSNAMLCCEAASRPYLAFISFGQCDVDSGRYHDTFQWLYFNRIVEECPEVHSCTSRGFVAWQWIGRFVYNVYCDFVHSVTLWL